VGDRPAACLRHQSFETDEFVSDPARFGSRIGPARETAGAGTRPEESRAWVPSPEQQSAQSTPPSYKPTHEIPHHDPRLLTLVRDWEGLC
jgi:hypothetical protein